MRIKTLAPVVAGILLAAAGTANAATKTASFTVTANVLNNCVIAATPLALGDFDGTNDLANTSNVSVRCTNGTPFTVNLSAGNSNNFTARIMSNGTDTLSYNLYTSSAHATVWGDNSGSTDHMTGTGAGMAAANAVSLTVYGQLLAAANTGPVGAGTYTDTIIASVVY